MSPHHIVVCFTHAGCSASFMKTPHKGFVGNARVKKECVMGARLKPGEEGPRATQGASVEGATGVGGQE